MNTVEDLIRYYTDKGLTRGQALQAIKQVVDRASKGIILKGNEDKVIADNMRDYWANLNTSSADWRG